MIRIKCPKCANPLAIPDTQAGGVGSCPKCGQKFRVPAVAAKPSDPSRPEAAARPRTDRVHEEASSPKAGRKEAALEGAAARAAAKTTPTNRQPAAGEPGGQGYGVGPAPETARPPRPPGKREEDEDTEERDEEDTDYEEKVPRRKKRKKKKKKPEAVGPSGAHIAMVVGGLFVVAAVTGLFFLFVRGSGKTEIDPGPVLAELERIHAGIERNQKSPDKPVIGITLSGCEFKGELLKNLAAFPQLRKLNLGSTLTSDVKLEWLENVTTLRVLDLSHTKVTGGGMQFLKKMVNLEELNLTQTLVDDVRLNELKGLTKLKKIYLDGTLASGMGLKESIPDLEIIR